MVSPSPVPPKVRLVEVSACWNASKINSCFSEGMPIPVSETAKASTCSALRSAAELNPSAPNSTSIESATRPDGVNLKALESRFFSTCCSRGASVRIIPGTAGEIEIENSIPGVRVGRNVRSSASATSLIFTGRTSTCSLPDSIFERSRIWLMSESRSCPLEWMVAAYCTSSALSEPRGFSASKRARMSTLFSGVRSSCDMLARNSDL